MERTSWEVSWHPVVHKREPGTGGGVEEVSTQKCFVLIIFSVLAVWKK